MVLVTPDNSIRAESSLQIFITAGKHQSLLKTASILLILEDFVSQKIHIYLLAWPMAMVLTLIATAFPAAASTRIRGEFEYDVDEGEISEWQIGPTFTLDESEQTELEIPIGQDGDTWQIVPELTYEADLNDFSFEFSVGAEIPFSGGEEIQPFGSIEGSVDF